MLCAKFDVLCALLVDNNIMVRQSNHYNIGRYATQSIDRNNSAIFIHIMPSGYQNDINDIIT